jgi:hypothetical protein
MSVFGAKPDVIHSTKRTRMPKLTFGSELEDRVYFPRLLFLLIYYVPEFVRS